MLGVVVVVVVVVMLVVSRSSFMVCKMLGMCVFVLAVRNIIVFCAVCGFTTMTMTSFFTNVGAF